MKKLLGCMAIACSAWVSVEAKEPVAAAATNARPAVVATNVPAGAGVTNVPAAGTTQAVVVAAVEIPAAIPEWTGYVRVLRGDQGEVRAVRLVVGDKLVAVEMNEKARELADSPKTRNMLVTGALEERDGRAWLVVSGFKEAPSETAPVSAPVAATNAPAAPPAP